MWVYVALGAVLGAGLMVVAAALLLLWLTSAAEPSLPVQPPQHTCAAPQAVLDALQRGGTGSEGAVNAALQFIFQQSAGDASWLRRRVAAELEELLAKAPSGRLFESLTLRSLDVGRELPCVSNVRLLSGSLEEGGGRLRSLDLALDLSYAGAARIDLDAVMLLGKRANISVTVESVSGPVRLLFRRSPYTHWGLAFEVPPRLELGVRGRFQGRQIKPRLSGLVAAHIRRAVAQRHTMPNYKIRYKPFFPKSEPGGTEVEEGPTPSGRLSVSLLEVTRLRCSCADPASVQVHLVVCVDSHAWVSLRRDALTLDVTLPAGGGQLGLVCCQTLGARVAVDTVVPMSAAYLADVRRGDVLLAVDGEPAASVAQVGRLLRRAGRRAVTLRVRRVVPNESGDRATETASLGAELKRAKSNTFSLRRVSEVMDGVCLRRIKVAQGGRQAQTQDTEQEKSLDQPDCSPTKRLETAAETGVVLRRRRRCSVEHKSSDSSAANTPCASGASTPRRCAGQPEGLSDRPTSEIPAIKTESCDSKYYDKLDPKMYDWALAGEENTPEDGTPRHIQIRQLHSTKPTPLKSIMSFEDRAEFKLNENHKYLNINVWGAAPGDSDDTLLGYLNVPLASLLAQCAHSTLDSHVKIYQLLPPDIDVKFSHPLTTHAGFEPCLCFGDALVWWRWEPGSPPPPPQPAPTAPPHHRSRQHDFLRTHFHRSTQCDFCAKKIWLKDAMQCRRCGLCCHKKCVDKCQENSPCRPADDAARPTGSCSPPELITTEADCPLLHQDSDEQVAGKGSFDIRDEGGVRLRRAGSAHTLRAPHAAAAHASSLPPSPSHTPRKQSLEAAPENPFAGVGAAWRSGGEVAALLSPVVGSALSADELLAAARDSAPDLAQQLPLDSIHELLCAARAELARQLDERGLRADTRRARALTALMLHCCCAAQRAQSNSST